MEQEEHMITLELLPPEILEQIMMLLDGVDLFHFSQSCNLFFVMSRREELWKNAYCLSLPKTHCALMQPPPPDYWTFSETPNRWFLYLSLCHNNKNQHLQLSEIDLVIEVMRMNMARSLLLLVVCYVIRRLTYTPPGCTTEYRAEMAENRKRFGAKNVVPLLLEILEDKFENSTLIAAALCALNNIACDVTINCQTIVTHGGIKAIVQSMQKYNTVVAVLDYGSSALANITREVQDNDYLAEILTEGVELAKRLFELDKAAAANVVSGLDLFTVLARHKYEFRKEFGATALGLVKDLLLKYKDESNLISGCCRAIHEFCKSSDENRQLAMQLNLTSMLLNRLEEERDSSLAYSIIFALCFIFWKKTNEEKDNFRKFVTISIERLKAGLEEARFQLGVAIILGNFASCDNDNLKFIKSFNVSRLLAEAIRKNAKKPSKYADILQLFEDMA